VGEELEEQRSGHRDDEQDALARLCNPAASEER
jgi:hypothetical protein